MRRAIKRAFTHFKGPTNPTIENLKGNVPTPDALKTPFPFKVDRHRAAHLDIAEFLAEIQKLSPVTLLEKGTTTQTTASTTSPQPHLPTVSTKITDSLDTSLSTIQAQAIDPIKSVWATLSTTSETSLFLPILLDRGFTYHHARGNTLVLHKWIAKGEEDNIPLYATHSVGAGGIVIDRDTHSILLNYEMSYRGKIWKLPGGQINSNEFIRDGVVREIKEETGIDCEFKGIIAAREIQNFKFGAPDLYFVCLLTPRNKKINYCTQEILDCKWHHLKDLASLPGLPKSPLYELVHDVTKKLVANKFNYEQMNTLESDKVKYMLGEKEIEIAISKSKF